jgi:hypothetical protein
VSLAILSPQCARARERALGLALMELPVRSSHWLRWLGEAAGIYQNSTRGRVSVGLARVCLIRHFRADPTVMDEAESETYRRACERLVE